MEKSQEIDIQVRRTGSFKLKDKENRNYQAINLIKQFGFLPEVIIIEKEQGRSNAFRVLAVLTEEEKKLEANRIKNLEATKPNGKSKESRIRAKQTRKTE